MARGRFVNKSMNDNARLEAMSIECVDFFKRVISISDVEGRLRGESGYLRNVLYPLRDSISNRQVEGWINVLNDSKDGDTGLGLLERYDQNGRQYIWFPGFGKHQKGLRKDREAPSEMPTPPAELMEKARERMVTTRGQVADKPKTDIRTDDLKVAQMIKYYEDNVGRGLMPLELKNLVDFADHYPDGWFEKAVDEVKNSTKTIRLPMSYIEKIMENWQTEGVNPFEKRGAKTNQRQSTTAAKLKDSTKAKLR